MTTTYNRVTSIGYNTGKIIIGSTHIRRPRAMYPDEFIIQELLLSKRVPGKRVLRSVAQRLALWVGKGIAKVSTIAQRAAKWN